MANWILTALYKTLWGIFVSGPLYLISGFSDILHYLAGGVVWDLLFGGKQDFSWSTIPASFWGFCILGAAIICLIFLVQYLILLFNDSKETRNKLVTAVKMTAFACVFVFFIPIGYFLLNQLINFVVSILSQVFGIQDSNIAGMLWNIGNPNWNGKDIYKGGFFDTPDNILDYNIIAEIFGVWFIGYAFLMLGFGLVQKIFELFFLFIIGPLVATTMVNDNGKRMLTWKDYVIAKSLAAIGTVIAYYTFMIGIGAIFNSSLGDFGGAARQILIILLICGGALACLGISTIVASFVGEGVGISEGRASLASTMAAASLTLGAGKMVGRAIGLGKNKKLSKKNESRSNSADNNASNKFQQENAGTNSTADDGKQGFKLPMNGLRKRSGLVGMAGTALALASSKVFDTKASYDKRVKKYAKANGNNSATTGDKLKAGVSTIGARVTGITAAKHVGRKVKGAARAVKKTTHGTYQAKKAHHDKKNE